MMQWVIFVGNLPNSVYYTSDNRICHADFAPLTGEKPQVEKPIATLTSRLRAQVRGNIDDELETYVDTITFKLPKVIYDWTANATTARDRRLPTSPAPTPRHGDAAREAAGVLALVVT